MCYINKIVLQLYIYIIADFEFDNQKSKHQERRREVAGLLGEECCLFFSNVGFLMLSSPASSSFCQTGERSGLVYYEAMLL